MDYNNILRIAGYRGETLKNAAIFCRDNGIEEIAELRMKVNKKFGPPNKNPSLNEVPYNKIIPASGFEPEVYNQMGMAMSIPPALSGALMPDAHPGYSVPIGGVVLLNGAISPAFVGVDIACSVTLALLPIDAKNLEDTKFKEHLLEVLKKVTHFGPGNATFGDGVERSANIIENGSWNISKEVRKQKEIAQRQLGSSGGGNHFADIVGVVKSGNPAYLSSVKDSEVIGLMLHSGSRKAGYNIARYYSKLADEETAKNHTGIPKGYGWFDIDSTLGREYYFSMLLMERYTLANHTIIVNRFSEELGVTPVANITTVHNIARYYNTSSVIHRKGAINAAKGMPGVIPGSAGTFSYLVNGKGNEFSLNSASHGAGRPMSRTKSKALFDEEKFRNSMNGIVHSGIDKDETPMAYKDINEVMDAQKDCVEIDAILMPKVVLMGGKADDGD